MPTAEITLTGGVEATVTVVRTAAEVSVLPLIIGSGGGGDAGIVSESLIAGTALSGHRVVYKSNGEVYYADKDLPATVKTIIGITTHAASSGASVNVILFGELTEPSWSWSSPLSLFLGNSGQITEVAPSTGERIKIGSASNLTTINVKIEEGITLI